MSELPRRVVARLRRFLGNRRRTKRAPAQLRFTLRLADLKVNSNGSRRLPTLDGHTLDVSTTGMALAVRAIRIGEHYLTGEDRKLNVRLELPAGAVEMTVAPVRYESLEEDQAESGYVIGARITEMTESDRARFDEYVSHLLRGQPGSDVK